MFKTHMAVSLLFQCIKYKEAWLLAGPVQKSYDTGEDPKQHVFGYSVGNIVEGKQRKTKGNLMERREAKGKGLKAKG